MSLPIIPHAQITPVWMTQVLQGAGVAATVTALSCQKVGTGQVGESMRFTLTYAGDPAGAPATVVGKFPSPDPESRGTGIALGNYIREVNFYRQLAAGALITLPKVFHTDVDPATSDFVLIMEDLSPANQGDQLLGVSLEQAGLAMDEAAKLHASHWGDASMDQLPWLQESAAAPQITDPGFMTALWEGFQARYGARIRPDCIEIGNAVTAHFARYRAGTGSPKCLVHNDYRPDNMMFGTAQGGYPLAVVDWQSVAYGCCMADVSYFLAGALNPAERRAHERDLLTRYHRKLTSLGVRDYSFDQLWRDYAHYSFSLFVMAFAASMIVGRTERGDAMFFAMLESGAAQVTDLAAVALLTEG